MEARIQRPRTHFVSRTNYDSRPTEYMGSESRREEIVRAREYLTSAPLDDLVSNMLSQNPWFCEEEGVSFADVAQAVLDDADQGDAQLFLVGSAGLGFSLAPQKAGRRFRGLDAGKLEKPSDFDVALVDASLFEAIWNSMTEQDRLAARWSRPRDRKNVYWGRIDQTRVPPRTEARRTLLNLSAALTRAKPFRGYKTSVRVYRRMVDLHFYTKEGLNETARTLGL